MHGGGCLGPEKPSPRPPSNYPLMIILGNIHLKFYPESRAKTKIRIFMCDLFLVVALHYVCLFSIFMRKNSRKINMVIGQTTVPATPINVNIFFVLKKVPAFLQFTVHARKTSKLKAAEFLAIGHQTKQILFFVCVWLSIIIAVPPTSLSL